MVRKRKFFDIDLITSLRELGLTWTAIRNHPDINASKDCLRRWRDEVGFADPKQKITNDQVDNLVNNYSQGQPRRGEVTIAAHVATTGFYVPRQQLRESIHRVDPEGVEERSRKPIKRKVYYSNGPHHDWHMDGNHKLIRWGMVIHGCIDGCSRNIIYLQLRDNNKSDVVLDAFLEGVSQYQLPLHVSGDFGGENVKVAEYMIRHRGPGTKAFKAVPSTHNTRIERLWRDMRENTIQAYIDLFRGFEEDGMLLTNLLHIFTLQFLFMPRIQADLDQFVNMWNSHKLSTERNRTPQQILNFYMVDSTAAPEIVDSEAEVEVEVDDVDIDPRFSADGDELLHSVLCNPIECPLSDIKLQEFRQRVEHIPSLLVPFSELGEKYRQGLLLMNEIFNRTS